MNEQEILQSMIGKTIESIEPIYHMNNHIYLIEVTFTDGTVIDFRSEHMTDAMNGYIFVNQIVQGESNEE